MRGIVKSRFAIRLRDYLRSGFSPQAMRVRYGDYLFMQGRYTDALAVYSGVTQKDLLPWVTRQFDWISYKRGHVSIGWPRYPGHSFDLEAERTNKGLAWSPAATVARAAQPYELYFGLHLEEWDEVSTPCRSLLIWFNFTSSIGGEMFNLKVIKAFCRHLDFPVVLAVDPRLSGICQHNFPEYRVIGKRDNLSALREECSHFMLSRNALRRVVRSVEDFHLVSMETLNVPKMPIESVGFVKQRKVAISWKTTNRRQGKYRNIPLSAFAKALSHIEGVAFYSAQHGVSLKDIKILERYLGSRIVFDAFRSDGDVGEFAAHLSELDGAITIDNSVLHIAGAIGLPTVAMLSIPSYWMWPESGANSRWYPSVRLIHQRTAGNWNDVIGQVGHNLHDILRERT
jgi:hypothetical protein